MINKINTQSIKRGFRQADQHAVLSPKITVVLIIMNLFIFVVSQFLIKTVFQYQYGNFIIIKYSLK